MSFNCCAEIKLKNERSIMSLLTAQPKSKKITLSLRLDEELLIKVKSYNEWVGIDRVDDFFNQAARYVLEKDKDWKKRMGQSFVENK
jgi:hypothetical protein